MSLFHRKKEISAQTIRRLPQYLRIFYNLHTYGRELVSSTTLAEETQLLPIVIKKDLQAVGAAFDTHPEIVGNFLHGVRVYHTAQLASIIERENLKIAILTVPAEAAQGITDTLVAAGIKAIWNFAPVNLTVPEGVIVQKEDISSGLAELCAKLKR